MGSYFVENKKFYILNYVRCLCPIMSEDIETRIESPSISQSQVGVSKLIWYSNLFIFNSHVLLVMISISGKAHWNLNGPLFQPYLHLSSFSSFPLTLHIFISFPSFSFETMDYVTSLSFSLHNLEHRAAIYKRTWKLQWREKNIYTRSPIRDIWSYKPLFLVAGLAVGFCLIVRRDLRTSCILNFMCGGKWRILFINTRWMHVRT
jgi:hypothetical protein